MSGMAAAEDAASGDGGRTLAQLENVDETRLAALGRRLGGMLRAGDLIILDGPLGAGKTTLTRSIGAGLGVRGPVTSPTFVLARTHPSLIGGAPLVHVDAYRLRSGLELDDLDLDVEGAVTIVEWGHDWARLLADDWVEIALTPTSGTTRTVTVTAHGAGGADGLATRVESQLV